MTRRKQCAIYLTPLEEKWLRRCNTATPARQLQADLKLLRMLWVLASSPGSKSMHLDQAFRMAEEMIGTETKVGDQ